jgi:hypothetical protein
MRIKQFIPILSVLCFSLGTVVILSFKPLISELPKPPPDITNVTTDWILTGNGGCHVSGYKWTPEGPTGATSYEWEKTYSTTYGTWTTTSSYVNYFGDASCNTIHIRVKPCASGVCGNWYYFDGDDCTPFDNPDCAKKVSTILNKKKL